mgnify:CR=1 FL=1|jgi:S-methylmethionine-dependent homocysteine/selenocysteine methylase
MRTYRTSQHQTSGTNEADNTQIVSEMYEVFAKLAGYIVCQQTNDGSKFFQTTNVKKNTAEQKEYIDTAVSMMEKAQKRFLEMREEPKYTAGIAKSVIWDIMSSDKNFMETTQRLFAKTIYHNA